MSWFLHSSRYGTRFRQGLLVGVFTVLAIALALTTTVAQPAGTPSAMPQAPQSGATGSAAAASDPDQAQTASGDADADRQIGISFDESDQDERRNLHRVDDALDVLDLDERIELADDAQRLTNHGLPTIVVIREAAESREQSRAVAEQLRVERGVASRQGADDGLLMLVTIAPESPRSTSVVLSFGANALPKGGLTVDTAGAIHDDVMVPRLERGRLYSALHVGIRRIIYLETYLPDAQEPLSDPARMLQGAVNVIGPLALVGSAAGFVVSGRRPRRRGGMGTFTRTASLVGLGAICLFIASVIGRSAIGVAATALIALLIWTQYLIGRSSGEPVPPGSRRISLPPRRRFQKLHGKRHEPISRRQIGTGPAMSRSQRADSGARRHRHA